MVAAYRDVADAFDAYDDALMDAYGEVTPLEVYSGDEDDDLDDEDDDDLEFDDDEGDDSDYGGLGDEEYDTDESE